MKRYQIPKLETLEMQAQDVVRTSNVSRARFAGDEEQNAFEGVTIVE